MTTPPLQYVGSTAFTPQINKTYCINRLDLATIQIVEATPDIRILVNGSGSGLFLECISAVA
jgi:hypothetical protein